jgi:hypothetical protein
VGPPGGGGRGKDGKDGKDDPAEQAMHALADRIEDNLTRLFTKVQGILQDNEVQVLSITHALETHKTLNGEDVAAIIEGQPGQLVDGTPYTNPVFVQVLRDYHQEAVRAHRDHNQLEIALPVPSEWVTATVAEDDHNHQHPVVDPYHLATGHLNGGHPNGGHPNGTHSNGSASWNGWYETADDVISYSNEEGDEEDEDDRDWPPPPR